MDELVSSIIQLSRPWVIHGAWAQAGSAYIWMANVLSAVSVPKQSLTILREEECEQKNATRGITLLIYRFPPPCHATHGATSTQSATTLCADNARLPLHLLSSRWRPTPTTVIGVYSGTAVTQYSLKNSFFSQVFGCRIAKSHRPG